MLDTSIKAGQKERLHLRSSQWRVRLWWRSWLLAMECRMLLMIVHRAVRRVWLHPPCQQGRAKTCGVHHHHVPAPHMSTPCIAVSVQSVLSSIASRPQQNNYLSFSHSCSFRAIVNHTFRKLQPDLQPVTTRPRFSMTLTFKPPGRCQPGMSLALIRHRQRACRHIAGTLTNATRRHSMAEHSRSSACVLSCSSLRCQPPIDTSCRLGAAEVQAAAASIAAAASRCRCHRQRLVV